MTRIALVRHGVTSWNKEKRTQGHSHNPLDDEGIQQAHKVAERLSEEKWDVIIASDLLRAKQTAEIISDKLGIPIEALDERLRELGRGKAEGTTEDERIALWGADWRQLDIGFETAEQAMERGSECLKEIARTYSGKRVLVVSHGAILKHTLKKLIPALEAEAHLDNTSVTVLHRSGSEENAWSCELYNCTSHLQQHSENAAE
ncbi:histidine phosphatase family protein [Paenibacillus sp. NPDC056579]|uniref:histidine phosphatase family protein n=1 Tax=Paenibacillus sp. NPDC056579 TaxID=3345871 RepID=UPI00368BE56C